MGFLDKAKQYAEQAQEKIDEVQKNFNEGQQAKQDAAAGSTPATEYDKHGRPVPSVDPSGPPAPGVHPGTDPEPEGAADPLLDAAPAPPAPKPPSPPAPPPAASGEERDPNAPPPMSSGDPLAG